MDWHPPTSTRLAATQPSAANCLHFMDGIGGLARVTMDTAF
ncbi:hypothetical protein SS05631_c17830 [Sinorhizobium sp. CCBAU 05631]|nr:hypothetical protein SS05631_c17830 [Sinorhizobium sp. CCBAU 05631]